MTIICTDRVSVKLYYGANFKWHMPILEEICRAEQKYMPFFGTVTERHFLKKIQSTETYTNQFIAALGDGPAFWIFFFQDSRIRVNRDFWDNH